MTYISALEGQQLLAEYEEQLDKATDEKERAEIEAKINELIGCMQGKFVGTLEAPDQLDLNFTIKHGKPETD